MRKGVKRIIFNILLLFVGSIFGLFILEFGVRVSGLYNFPKVSFIQPHDELGWSHIPGKEGYWEVAGERIPVKINTKGLRDKEYHYEKGEDTFRILVLGDSFTEGFQVPLEETFCKVLERILNQKYRNIEVINAGFAGIGTDYELRFFQKEGFKYKPDVVLLAFFGNDIYENYRSKHVLENNSALTDQSISLVKKLKQFLANHSCAYNYLGLAIPKHMPNAAKWLMKFGIISYQPIENGPDVVQLHYLIFENVYGKEMESAWKVTEILISKLHKNVIDAEAVFAVVSIPFREQVYEKYWETKLLLPGMDKREWDLEKPDNMLDSFMIKEGIPFLKLLPVMRKEADKKELYYTGADGHWNGNGHKLAAETIENWLASIELIPSTLRNGNEQ